MKNVPNLWVSSSPSISERLKNFGWLIGWLISDSIDRLTFKFRYYQLFRPGQLTVTIVCFMFLVFLVVAKL